MPTGTSTITEAATGATGAGQSTSRYSTATDSASPQATTRPMAAHCSRSLSRPAEWSYRIRAAGSASNSPTDHASTPSHAAGQCPAAASAAPAARYAT